MSTFTFARGEERIDREYPIGRAPRAVVIGGKRYVRIPSVPTIRMADHVAGRDVRFIANSLDPKLYRHHTGQFVESFGEKVPAFQSKREIADFERRAADAGSPIKYGAAAESHSKLT